MFLNTKCFVIRFRKTYALQKCVLCILVFRWQHFATKHVLEIFQNTITFIYFFFSPKCRRKTSCQHCCNTKQEYHEQQYDSNFPKQPFHKCFQKYLLYSHCPSQFERADKKDFIRRLREERTQRKCFFCPDFQEFS